MKQRYKEFSLILLIVFIISFFACEKTQKPTLNIACAANFQYALKEINREFEKKYPVKCNAIIASTGKLTAQIKSAAPFNILIAANLDYPNYLEKENLLNAGPKIFAKGQLVLWSNILETPLDLATLSQVDKIAIASSKSAPFGIATETVLKKLKLYDSLKPKFIFGESIAQVNQFIKTKSVAIGFTSLSAVLKDKEVNNTNYYLIPQKHHKPIYQTISQIKQSDNSDLAKLYYDFFEQKIVQNILQKNGYLPMQ